MEDDSGRGRRSAPQRPRSQSVPPRQKSEPEELAPMLKVARDITRGMSGDPKFHIKGSMAAMLHGGRVQPGDLDLVVGSFPQINNVLSPMGYPKVSPFKPRIEEPPHGLPALDVLHSGDWGADNTPKQIKSGVMVTSAVSTIRDLKKDPRPEKRDRNARLIKEIIRANTKESPF